MKITVKYRRGNTESYISAMALIYAARIWAKNSNIDLVTCSEYESDHITDDDNSQGIIASIQISTRAGDETWNASRVFVPNEFIWRSTVKTYPLGGGVETIFTSETGEESMPSLSMPHIIWLAVINISNGTNIIKQGYPRLPVIIRMMDWYQQGKLRYYPKSTKTVQEMYESFWAYGIFLSSIRTMAD